MPRQRTRTYGSIQDWMAATGVNQVQLAQIVGIGQAHLSNILSRSRRCSLAVAVKLHQITGVPTETIATWPPRYGKAVK